MEVLYYLTDIQVKYWTLQEDKRHNRVYEQETQRHNLVTEQQGFLQIDENIRHNKETEAIGWGNLEETTRHNKVTEDFSYASLAETKRHNIAIEGIQQIQADAAWQNALTNIRNANTREREYALDYAKANYDINYTIQRTKTEEAKTKSQEIANKQAQRDWELRDQYAVEEGLVWYPLSRTTDALGGLGKSILGMFAK